ncbi:MAG TPA: multicopper oxidase domain-containing protein [Bacteriovoracaceae bacterium]|nr:multicopper oxidase domain-containing protein [Bacteriovoracaceae bacterium]
MKYYLFIFSILALTTSFRTYAKIVKYELNATKESIDLSGKKKVDFALLLNGGIPAPTLEFTEGDTAVIKVTNKIPGEEMSIHWHGLLLDPYMDGVPYVNTPPIHSGESFTFEFKIRQHGTYWYHSHTGVQEQKGIYGAFLIHPKDKKIKYDKDLVLVLSDWTDENPNQVISNLRKDGDYYTYKKDSMRSFYGAIKAKSFKNYLYNDWTRMGAMDLSDVGYDAFLINGKKDHQALEAHPGEKIRLRIINAAASSYFYLNLANTPMNVISTDGVDIKPVLAYEILIGMAETYDVLFEVPSHNNFEFKATAQDVTGSTSAWIGMGDKIPAPLKPKPDFYALMDHSTMDHSKMTKAPVDHSKMDHSSMDPTKKAEEPIDHSNMSHTENKAAIPLLTVNDLEAQNETTLPLNKPTYDVTLNLDGDMERYIWLINGKAIHQDRNLKINQGDVVRFTFVNKSMMHHPMHLHGHFFRVLNKFGKKSPLKHTVDIAPHTTKTIEFYADEPGEWMLHCHNLYHMKTGMARVVSYSTFKVRPDMKQHQKHDPHLHDHLYYRGMLEAATNHFQGEFYFLKTWDELELRAETRNDSQWQIEGDLFYKRWLSRYTHLIAGGTLVEGEGAVVAGFGYLFPYLIETHTIIDQKGRLRLNIERRFQWTKYIYTDAEFTFRQVQVSGFEVSLMYQKQWAWSAGLKFTEDSAGVGLQYQF